MPKQDAAEYATFARANIKTCQAILRATFSRNLVLNRAHITAVSEQKT